MLWLRFEHVLCYLGGQLFTKAARVMGKFVQTIRLIRSIKEDFVR